MNDFTIMKESERCLALVKYLARVVENGKEQEKYLKMWPVLINYVTATLEYSKPNTNDLLQVFTSTALIPLQNGTFIKVDPAVYTEASKELDSLNTILRNNNDNKVQIVPSSSFKYPHTTHTFLHQLGCKSQLTSEQIIDLILFWKENPSLDRNQISVLYNLLWKTDEDAKKLTSLFTNQALIYISNSWKKLNEVVWIEHILKYSEIYEKLVEDHNLAVPYRGLKTFFAYMKVPSEISAQDHLAALKFVARETNSGKSFEFDLKTFTMHVYSQILKSDFNDKSLPVILSFIENRLIQIGIEQNQEIL